VTKDSDLILVGAFGAAVGLTGEVTLASFTADPTGIARLGPLIAKDGRRFEILSLRTNTKGCVARVKGIETREAAEALKGVALHVARASLPPTSDEDYYHADLIGLAAVTLTGEALGEIAAVHNFGAGDLLELRFAARAKTVLVPFTREAVPGVDIAAGRVVIDSGAAFGTDDDAAVDEAGKGADEVE
jgi:16S rRNA processing protein RimM